MKKKPFDKIPDRELLIEEYYAIAATRVDGILESIIGGHRPMMNDLNLLTERDPDVMNPPTAWAESIMTLLEQHIDQVKFQYVEATGNDINWYIFKFKLRTSGLRSTILFSYTADLKR